MHIRHLCICTYTHTFPQGQRLSCRHISYPLCDTQEALDICISSFPRHSDRVSEEKPLQGHLFWLMASGDTANPPWREHNNSSCFPHCRGPSGREYRQKWSRYLTLAPHLP